MNRQLIRCGNYFGQHYKGVGTSSNIFLENQSSINSKVEDNIFRTLSNLYYSHLNLEKDKKRITVGGDHSISIATLAWTLNKYPKAKVLWVDAHADINTYDMSKSKNYHGMPLSYLTGMDYNSKFNFLSTRLNLKNLMYVGVRDLDNFEEEILNSNNIKHISVSTFNKNKFNKIYDFLEGNDYHLSFDVDAIDPEYIPSTGTPVNNGLKLESFLSFMKQLNTDKMINMDIVELNLELGNKEDIRKSFESIKQIEQIIIEKE